MDSKDEQIGFKIASEADSELVWKIVNRAFQDYRDSEAPSSALLESVDQVKKALGNGRERAVICYYGNDPAGAARFYSEEGLYFRRLGVLPEYRGKGLSKAIISWLENYAIRNGETRIWCNTRSSVERNMELYKKMGYSQVNERTVERNGNSVGIATFSKKLE